LNEPGREHMIDINLDFTHGGMTIRDQFLWDLTNPDNSPEEFAM
jgi:hypothetical protein